ncbi:sporulation protein [Bacillus coahuilensis m2-6]|uniref:Sporulation protein n=1 Tax=Bacillus coahuilensis p1.1.43 TaxID=1150625 RepID=A0A147K5P7_9BACI|nr:outer membrane lipoprotein carrier protein LolA [Bacillus coahuilensis]KUP04536.1 sporulation protein [Bacillus coahuilensis m2-6]KUP04942.1 sporulation protein [Bacillus coahuilensis p1.1.43]
MKKYSPLLLVVMLMLVLAACGTKTQEDVTKSLGKKIEETKSYKAEAQMTLQVGEEPQTYDVEVSYKDPNYYRVQLKNVAKDQSQIILRNDEGVFVLTPALNKSFKFQSDWPDNSSQAYLFESLVKDVLEDTEAKYTETEDYYVYETKTRYQNNQMLPIQEISFNKKELTPAEVKVMDTDRNALVTVKFKKVELGVSFDEDAFDMKKNMSNAQLDVAVMAEVEDSEFTVLYPTEQSGTALVEEKSVNTDTGKRVVLTYDGEKSFTLIQEKNTLVPAVGMTQSVIGDPVDLGFSVGAQTENSIYWSYNGVDYMLASTELSKEEMVNIAQSVQGTVIK